MSCTPFWIQAWIQCNFHRPVTCYNVQIMHVVFLISFYDTPLAQRVSYSALYSSLFGPDGAVNYDYIVVLTFNIHVHVPIYIVHV